jgi:hypothetical protein
MFLAQNTKPKGGLHDCRDKDSTRETHIATVGRETEEHIRGMQEKADIEKSVL